jgi:hypothetical protein
MADHKQPDTNRITPRDVEPDRKQSGGGSARRPTGDDRGLRREPVVEEADGGDISGVAGGSVDSHVSGLGGDKNRR